MTLACARVFNKACLAAGRAAIVYATIKEGREPKVFGVCPEGLTKPAKSLAVAASAYVFNKAESLTPSVCIPAFNQPC